MQLTEILKTGSLIRTNYAMAGAGPYRVIEVSSPCVCVDYVERINGGETPSQKHWHIIYVLNETPVRTKYKPEEKYYLNGYAVIEEKIRCVWRKNDEIYIEEAVMAEKKETENKKVKSKKLKCDEGIKSTLGNFCLLVQGKGEECEKKGCCIGCDEVATCKHPCGVAVADAGSVMEPGKIDIKVPKKKNNYCDGFVSASEVDKEADKDVCSYVYTTEDSCNGKICCIGCPEIMNNCQLCCEPAREKFDGAMAEHEKTMKNQKVEDKTSAALKEHDIEVMHRESKTAQIEGDSPYNKDTYVYECRFLLQKTAEAIKEVGKRLLVMKEREGHGNFTRIVEEEIGIPYTSANRFMNVAIKTGKFPKIDFSQFGRISNVYSLLEAPEEDLKELEEKGVLAGYGVDELAAMGVKEMRDTIQKLKSDTDKIVKEETKTINAEKNALIKENERLTSFDPEGKDIGWSEEQMKTVKKALDIFGDTARRFVFDDRILEHPELQVKVEGLISESEAITNLLRENWENFVCED